jgi:ribose transport system substrate-binding protein
MKRLGFLGFVGLAALLWSGCGGPAVEEGAIQTDTADQLYIEVSAIGSIDYFYDHKLGMKMAGEALGVRTEYVGPATRDMDAMVTAFEQAIVKKPNGILVVGFESVLNPIVDKAVDAGIPVVTVDADLPGSKRIAFVGTGNVEAGRVGARKVAELIGDQGKVAFMTIPGQSNLDDRIKGYKEELAKHERIEIVQTIDVQGDPTVAAQSAATLLQKHQDLAALICVEAVGGAGAATAVREAGKAGQVKVLAMDRGNEVLQAIGEGVISATIVQQTALMPFYGVQILYNLNNVDIPMTNDNRAAGISGAPTMIDTGVIVVDKSNCAQFVRN